VGLHRAGRAGAEAVHPPQHLRAIGNGIRTGNGGGGGFHPLCDPRAAPAPDAGEGGSPLSPQSEAGV
jgi:hypothetical protein